MPEGYRFLQDILPDINFVKSKQKSAKAYYTYFLDRCLEMFQYKNLPNTIPSDVLDKYLMINGIACITEDPNSQLRVFYGNLGGEQDCYYRPTEFIIANPHFKETFSKNCVVLGDEPHDGVLLRNDKCWFGLHAMLSRYSCLAAENILTIRVADIMLRITALLSAPSDKERQSALDYLHSLSDGELGVIGENPFFDGVKMQNPPSSNGSYLTQFIELQQYIKGSFYNEIGLSANYNMKREAIGKGESTLDQDALLPLCENMLRTRQEDFAKVNELYGTNITVDFSSAWLENMLQTKLILLTQSKEAGLAPKGDDNNEDIQKGGEESSETLSNGGDSESKGVNDNNPTGDSNSSEETGSEEAASQLTPQTPQSSQPSNDGVEDSGEVEPSGDDMGQDGTTRDDMGRDVVLSKVQESLDEALSQLSVEKGGNDGFGELGEMAGDENSGDNKGDISES